MNISIPSSAGDLFEKGDQYAVDDGLVLAYGLNGVTEDTVRKTCQRATESYAKGILNWPNGRLEKAEIFKPVSQVDLKDLDACAEHFVEQLEEMFDSDPPRMLSTYPHAFVVVSENNEPTNVIVVLAHKPTNERELNYCSIPVAVDLGLSITSLTVGDLVAKDILDDYGSDIQSKAVDQ